MILPLIPNDLTTPHPCVKVAGGLVRIILGFRPSQR